MVPAESNNTEKNVSKTVRKYVVSGDVKEKKILCSQLVSISNVCDSERPGSASWMLFSLAHLPIDVKQTVT